MLVYRPHGTLRKCSVDILAGVNQMLRGRERRTAHLCSGRLLGNRVRHDFRDLALSGSPGTTDRNDHGVAGNSDRRVHGFGENLIEDDSARAAIKGEQPTLNELRVAVKD